MARITSITDLTNIFDPKQFMRFCAQAIKSIGNAINGNLEFDSNLKTQTVQFYFAVAYTDYKIVHNLNKTTVNYIVVNLSAGTQIFNGVTANTSNAIYLRSNVSQINATLILF
jgi:hypothetical protein